MQKQTQIEEQVNKLDNKEANRLFRNVFIETGLSATDSISVLGNAHQVLSEAFNEINSDVDQSKNTQEDIVKQSLRVFANDPVMEDFLVPGKVQQFKEKPLHFNVDVQSFMTTTTLALVVLSSYININKDKDGKWTFQFRIKNSSESLKKEVINLAKRIINILPNK